MVRGKKAFTLVELLVVISIIALLLAVLMPSLSKARKLSQSLVCRSNLKELGLALSMYVSQNNDKFIAAFVNNQRIDQISNMWPHVLLPYLGGENYSKNPANRQKAMNILLCPSTKKPAVGTTVTTWGTATRAWRLMLGNQIVADSSYGVSGWLYPREDMPSSNPEYKWYWHRFSAIKSPSDCAAFGDSVLIDGLPDNGDMVNFNINDPVYGSGEALRLFGWFMSRHCIDRHSKSVNMLLVDGHVANTKLGELWALRWNRMSMPKFGVKVPRVIRTN